MNKIILSSALVSSMGLLCVGGVQAQELGRVISSTPMYQQVAVPRQVCSTQPMAQQANKSGAGAVMGAIAGGAMGNAMGKGSGNAATTAIGILGGALLGDMIEGASAPEVRQVQTCTNQMFYENRSTGYNVVYEFNGKQYTVVMPSDPGPTVRLQLTPMPSAPTLAAPINPVSSPISVPPAGSAPQS
ncbi:MAG: hypothetical protein QM527_15055 [Alphaproteobacteria bacterium]|nr:hypothetical protein [Alphaproteobacteria bacterium]